MFIEMNKSKQLANTLIYQDILQLTWKSSYWRKYINLMLFTGKRVNTYWSERDSMGRGELLSQKLQVIFFSVAKATLQSQMSVHSFICSFVRLQNPPQLKIIILHPSSFILHHFSFILHHSPFILPSFRDF